MGTYTFAQLEGFWDGAGGDPALAPTMAAIAEAESSGSDQVQQGQPYATTGWGLWQITPGDSEPSIGVDNALLNPAVNAEAAVAKEKSQGLGAWTTYSSGAYQKFMPNGTVTPTATPASYTDATQASVTSDIASGALGAIMSGFGIGSVQDLAERAALILFGAAIVVIAILRMTKLDNKAVEVGKGVVAARTGGVA